MQGYDENKDGSMWKAALITACRALLETISGNLGRSVLGIQKMFLIQ